MKFTKIIALAAVAVMGCTAFYGCGEGTGIAINQQSDSVVGVWQITAIGETGKKPMTLDEYAKAQVKGMGVSDTEAEQLITQFKIGMANISLDLKEDGSVVAKNQIGQTASQASYVRNGNMVTITVDGDSQELEFNAKDGTLTMTQDGMDLILTRIG